MRWIEVSIATTSSGTEHIEALLLGCGVSGWQVDDIKEMREFLDSNPQQWDYIEEHIFQNMPEHAIIRFFVADGKAGRAMAENVKAKLAGLKDAMPDFDFGPLTVTLTSVEDESWHGDAGSSFKPVEIGKLIVIKPEWELYPDSGKIFVNINPGNAFGTGLHETTRLCIIALERCIKHGDIMLDIGCGSGILSIVGLMLGAKKCIAVDNNPDAAGAACKNAAMNGIPKENLRVLTGDIFNDLSLQEEIMARKYDCIAANIVADAIIELSAHCAIRNCIKPGGVLITSGIITERLGDVLSALEKAGYNDIETETQNKWACVTAKA